MWLHEQKGKSSFWRLWIQTYFKTPMLPPGSSVIFDLMGVWFLRLGLSLATETHTFRTMQLSPVSFRGNVCTIKVASLYLALWKRTFFENVKPCLGKCCSRVEASPMNPKQPQSALITRLVVDLRQHAEQLKAVMACLQLKAADGEGGRADGRVRAGLGSHSTTCCSCKPRPVQGSRPYCLSSVKYELCSFHWVN